MTQGIENYHKAAPSPEEQLERDIETTIWTVLDYGGIEDAERSRAGATVLRKLLVQLLRERPDAAHALLAGHPADQEDTERKEWRCAPGEHSWQRFPQISDGIVCAKCGADQEDTDGKEES